MLIRPPASADAAPCPPAISAAIKTNDAVAMNCHRSTVRTGFLRRRSMAFEVFAPAKPRNCIATQSFQALQELLEMTEARIVQYHCAASLARGPDLYRGAEPLGEIFFEPQEIAISSFLAPCRGRAQEALHEGLGLPHR